MPKPPPPTATARRRHDVRRETRRCVGVVRFDAVRRPRSRSGTAAGAARRCPRRRRAVLLRHRRRHRRSRLCLQAADRPLLGATGRGRARGGVRIHQGAVTRTSRSCSMPSAATSARPPSSTPARCSGATAPTPSPTTRTSAPTPPSRCSPAAPCSPICRTSNPGSGELQDLDVGGRPLYERVAEMVATRWTQLGECGLVVGATYPAQLALRARDRRRPADPRSRRRRRRVATSPPRCAPGRRLPAPGCCSARRARSSTRRPATTSPRRRGRERWRRWRRSTPRRRPLVRRRR